jgi:hypothetical protein
MRYKTQLFLSSINIKTAAKRTALSAGLSCGIADVQIYGFWKLMFVVASIPTFFYFSGTVKCK